MANYNRKMRIGAAGQTGRFLYQGIFAFTTTGTTKTVSIPMGRVESVIVTPLGTPGADEVLSVNNTLVGTAGTDSCFIRTGDGNTDAVVTRTGAAPVSGLKFSLVAIGY